MFSPSLIAREVEIIAQEFQTVAPIVEETAGISEDVAAKANEALNGLRTTAQALADADQSTAMDLIDRVQTDVNAVLGAWLPLPLPGWAITTLRIAQVATPSLTAIARLVWPDLQNKPQARPQTGG